MDKLHIESPSSWRSYVPIFTIAVVAIFAVLAFTLIPRDTERYWLLYVGNWELVHGKILEALQGSWYPHQMWVNQEWFVALATAWTNAHGVYILMELLYAAALIFGLSFIAYETIRTRTSMLIACLQLFVAGIGAIVFAQDRAQTLAWALLPGLILVWRRAPWAAIPLLALWANVHGSFPLGIVWMALHLDRRRALPFILATLATLVNPLGWHLWVFVIGFVGSVSLSGYVDEWMPIIFSNFGVFYFLLALTPLLARWINGDRLSRPVYFGDFVWLMLAILSPLLAARYILLLLLTSATILGDLFYARSKSRLSPMVTWSWAISLAILLAAFGMFQFRATPMFFDPVFSLVERGTNFSACTPLVRGKRVFTDALQGGSLTELAGGSPNIDGRIDAFPLQAERDASTVINGYARSAEIVQRSGASVLLLDVVSKFQPVRPWRLQQTCGDLQLYTRS